MKSELKNNSYIKDIENYFLKITGRGLMLSGKDYSLISKWYQQAISKERVLKAIQKAVESKETSKIKGIASLKDNIESYLKTNEEYITKPEARQNTLSKTLMLKPVMEKLCLAIEKSENDLLIQLLKKTKLDVENIQRKNDVNHFQELGKIEKKFMETCFSQIDKKAQNRILEEAESKMPEESRYFDEESRNNSLIAFRNEIILKELSLQNLFELK